MVCSFCTKLQKAPYPGTHSLLQSTETTIVANKFVTKKKRNKVVTRLSAL